MVRTVVVIAGAVALALGAAGVAFVGGRQDQSELISAPSTSDATLPPRAPSTTVVEEQAVGRYFCLGNRTEDIGQRRGGILADPQKIQVLRSAIRSTFPSGEQRRPFEDEPLGMW